VQPVIFNPPSHGLWWTWARGSTQYVQHVAFDEGTLLNIDKVVLMRAGSVTHHADVNQRCVQLDFTVVPARSRRAAAHSQRQPASRRAALRCSWHNQGTPSQAAGQCDRILTIRARACRPPATAAASRAVWQKVEDGRGGAGVDASCPYDATATADDLICLVRTYRPPSNEPDNEIYVISGSTAER
jgi:hypothetical protein